MKKLSELCEKIMVLFNRLYITYLAKNQFYLPKNERLKDYLGLAFDKKVKVNLTQDLINNSYLINGKKFAKYYTKDLKKIKKLCPYHKEYFDIGVFGDIHFDLELCILAKTRPFGTFNNIIIPLEMNRHFFQPIRSVMCYDIKWEDKNNKLIWRGATTNMDWHNSARKNLIRKYFDHPNKNIDVGYTLVCQMDEENAILEKKYLKNEISIKEQLQSKFLMSLEGNDVASNLKWICYSNSVVIMPKPTIESWFLESKLKEWVHYIPIEQNGDDLEEKYLWGLENLDKCKKIAQNSKKYAMQFYNSFNERKIKRKLINSYYQNVEYIANDELAQKYPFLKNKKNVIILK